MAISGVQFLSEGELRLSLMRQGLKSLVQEASADSSSAALASLCWNFSGDSLQSALYGLRLMICALCG